MSDKNIEFLEKIEIKLNKLKELNLLNILSRVELLLDNKKIKNRNILL
jgi:hypothetical protein